MQKLIVILLILLAVTGLILYIRHERRQNACGGGCSGCPLQQKCTRPERKDD